MQKYLAMFSRFFSLLFLPFSLSCFSCTVSGLDPPLVNQTNQATTESPVSSTINKSPAPETLPFAPNLSRDLSKLTPPIIPLQKSAEMPPPKSPVLNTSPHVTPSPEVQNPPQPNSTLKNNTFTTKSSSKIWNPFTKPLGAFGHFGPIIPPYSEAKEPWIEEKTNSSGRQILNNCECGVRNPGPRLKGRIVNGYSTVKHEYPWQVYLQVIESRQTVIINGKADVNYGFRSCAASIINDLFMLTAAHCMVDEKIGQWRRVKRTSDIKGKIMVRNRKEHSPKEIEFEKIIVHPGYLAFKPTHSGASVTKNLHDIALLKLTERLPLEWSPFLKPVCLPEANDIINIQEGLPAKVIGWGVTSRGHGAAASDLLLQLNFAMHNASTCDKYSGPGDASRFVCGEELYSETGSAQGDSGGPLCIQMGNDPNKLIQIGVVSFTNNGQFTFNGEVIESYSLGFYSSVMSFLPFIDYYSHGARARWCQRRP